MIKLLILVMLSTLLSCSKTIGEPSYKFQKSRGDGVVAQFGEMKITEKELFKGIESDIYEAELKAYDIKFNKVKSTILEKLISGDKRSKGLSNDQFLEKHIATSAKVSDTDINAFIKEKKIPAEHINDKIKERIKNFLANDKKKEAIESWMNSKLNGKTIDVFFEKPMRPRFNVAAGTSPFMGGKDAKVTIVEFSDFQCPFCSKALPILKDLKKKYGNKIKVVFKQYPLPFHKQARGAAMAALCAHEQGGDNFWKMHDYMFANQSSLAVDSLKKAAGQLMLDMKKFGTCMDTNKYEKQIASEEQEGKDLGVKSTPTFFVNGVLVSGAQPVNVFSEIIDAELK